MRGAFPLTISTTDLEAKFGRAAVAELASLARESDAQLYAEGVLNLAQRLEAQDRIEAAADLYASLAGAEHVQPLRECAQRQLDALQGKGSFGPRAEFLLRRLSKDATHPSSIFAMSAAGFAFRLTRVATLSRLALSPAGFVTRGFGLRASGALVGFGVETLAFTAAGKGSAALLGERVDLSSRAWARDWAAGALTLGVLKGAGALTQSGLRRWAAGDGAWMQAAHRLAPQLAMFGGLLAVQGLEEALGWRATSSASQRLLDALASLVHFHVGGQLAKGLLGREFRTLEHRLDVHSEQIARGYSPKPFLASNLAMAGAPPLSPAAGAKEDLFAPRPLLSQAQSSGLGAYSGPTFLRVRQIETRLSKGTILLDLATRQRAETRDSVHAMYSLEDGFTSLLLGYQTRESALLKGPLVELLREDAALRKFYLEHGSDPAKRLWGFIDADTGELQRLAAFDKANRPRSILLWDLQSDGKGERAAVSTLLALDIGQGRPEFPNIVPRLFSWDAKDNRLRQAPETPAPLYNEMSLGEALQAADQPKTPSGDPLLVRIFPGTSQELHFKVDGKDSHNWLLSDAAGKLLMSMTRQGKSGGNYFEYSRFAPPLPWQVEAPSALVENPAPSRPAFRAPKETKASSKTKNRAKNSEISVQKPEASPASPTNGAARNSTEVSSGLHLARATLLELEAAAKDAPHLAMPAMKRLRNQMRLLAPEDLERLCEGLASRVDVLLRIGAPGMAFFRQEMPGFPAFLRLRMASALAEALADPNPPRRAQAFDVFRQVAPRLGVWTLQELQKFMEKKFPKGSLPPDRRMMVDQVRVLIREALSNAGGSGSLPPPSHLAMLLGVGTLLGSGNAEASSGDLLMGFAPSFFGEPSLGALLFASATTLALRSRVAHRLAQEVLTLGSALMSRINGGKTPIVLARAGAHPYELHLPDFASFLHKGAEAVIAKREGRDITLKTGWLSTRLPAYETLPEGTLRLNFRVEEGDRQGIAVVYLQKDAIHLQNIDTERMRPGVGTMLIDWLATQAALRGMSFHIRDTHNPQIFRILNREGIFLTGSARATGTYHDPHTANKLRITGPIEDGFFTESHQAASFQISGALNPNRLPFYLRLGMGASSLQLPDRHL